MRCQRAALLRPFRGGRQRSYWRGCLAGCRRGSGLQCAVSAAQPLLGLAKSDILLLTVIVSFLCYTSRRVERMHQQKACLFFYLCYLLLTAKLLHTRISFLFSASFHFNSLHFSCCPPPRSPIHLHFYLLITSLYENSSWHTFSCADECFGLGLCYLLPFLSTCAPPPTSPYSYLLNHSAQLLSHSRAPTSASAGPLLTSNTSHAS